MEAHPDVGAERRARLAAARLYLVCDSSPGGRELLDVLAAAIAGGVEIVQLRDKSLSDDGLMAVARGAAPFCQRLGALFVVNDRPEVAREAGADGVHVGQHDMPVAQVREVVGTDMLVGLSTHTPKEIDSVQGADHGAAADSRVAGDNSARVDYIGVGPVHPTPTKPGRPAVGLELVRHAAANATLPFFAIGGIHAGNAAAVLDAGARRLAVVRAIAEASDPRSAALELHAALDSAGESSCFQAPAA
ncbi:MAG TPA: thiamine phosphate synthase [Solirubrobacteraceae bacterium]|jgi:thiamine-phosphate pyrophosphorylase